jgi:hypothetical protein
MARLTSYINQDPSDNDLLTGSEYLSFGNYKTGNYKLVDLAKYFASFQIQNNTGYNLATMSQSITTNTTETSANATLITSLTAAVNLNDSNIALKPAIFRQDDEPGTTGVANGSLWYDTNDGNKLYILTGGSWVATPDTRIASNVTGVSSNASNITANVTSLALRPRVFRQDDEPPVVGIPANSLWYDTNDNNKLYIFNGSAWVLTDDSRIGTAVSSLATANESIITNATNISAEATKITELESQFVYTNGEITSVADALATSITTTATSAAGSVAADLDKLEAVFSFDSSGDVDGTNGVLSTAVTTSANAAIANAALASAQSVTELSSTVNGHTSSISTQASTLSTVKGYTEARYSLNLNAGGAVAGMSIFAVDANGDPDYATDPYSEIRFLADKFKIFNNGTAGDASDFDAPFEVSGGVVKIKTAHIGDISFGDISDAPATTFTSVVYASDASGTSPSFTKGTRPFYAIYQGAAQIDLTSSSAIAALTFNQITGSTGSSGADAKTIKLSSDALVVKYDSEGNNPDPSTITLTANSTNFIDGFFKFTGGGSVFTDETTYTDGTAANQDTATITVPTTFSGFGSPLAMRVGVAEGDQVEDAFDTLNIAPVKAGANGLTIMLSNDSHSVPASSNGTVSSFTGSGTDIVVFDGATEYNSVAHDATPGNNEFKVTTSVTTGTITLGAQDISANKVTFADHSVMTTDLAIIEYTINVENTTTIKKYQTLNKSKEGVDGADGSDGSAGTDARAVNLTSQDLSFEYTAAGTTPSPTSVTVTATALNTTGTVYYEFFLNDVSTGTATTTNTYTYTPKAAYADMPEKVEVQIKEGAASAAIVARDQITMFGIKPGGDGTDGTDGSDGTDGTDGSDGVSPYAVILTNEAHTLPTTNAGTVTYTGSGTDIQVYKGITQLNSVTGTPGAGEFKVTATATNITTGAITVVGNPAVVADHSAMTANNGSISFAVNCENIATITKIQTLSKSVGGSDGSDGSDGADGADGADGSDGAQGPAGPQGPGGGTGATGARSFSKHLYYSTAVTSQPSFNSTGVGFSFGTNLFSGLPTGWSESAPEATPGSGSNNYWHIPITVVEGSPANTLTFGSVTRMFGFSGLVTFSGTTINGAFDYTAIDGSDITTGAIQSTDYVALANSNYSDTGTKITLSNGRIESKNFFVAADGSAGFKGALQIGSTTLSAANTLNENTSKSDVGLSNVSNTSLTDIRAGVTKANVGLGNVDNTSDATVQANTLAAATKADVGLSNVDNSSDATIQAGTTKANVGLSNVDNNSTATIRSVGAATSGTVAGWILDSTAIYSGTKDISGYTTGGITLNSGGSIHSKQFYIDTSGNAHFKGNLAAASGTFSGNLSAAGGTFSGNIVVTGAAGSTNAPATISGLAAANDLNGRPTALLLKNSATTTGFDDSVALELQSSARWHHVIQMFGGQDQDGNFDLSAQYRLGKSCTTANCGDNYSTVKMMLNGGGLIIPDVSENAPSNYNPAVSGDDFQYGTNIFFNSNNASTSNYNYARMHLNEYYNTFFLDVPRGASHSSGSTAYDNRYFVIRKRMNTAIYPNTSGTWHSHEILAIDNNDKLLTSEILDIDSTAHYIHPGNTGTSINVAGDIVAYASSDKRLKENIKPIENALDKVNKISGVTFEWNEQSHKQTGKKDVGVIAQEIEAVLPELVDNRSNGYKAVDYPKLTALLIEAVKDLSNQVKELKDGVTK